MVADEEGKSTESNAGIAYGVGFGSGLLIYMTMFIFGAMVMRGVAEEKIIPAEIASVFLLDVDVLGELDDLSKDDRVNQ